MAKKKSVKQAYLLGLGIGVMAGWFLSLISYILVFVIGVGLVIAAYKFREIGKEAEDFFEVKDD